MVTVKKISTLNKSFEKALKLRQQIASLKAQIEPLDEQLKEVEALILSSMLEGGTEAHKTAVANVSLRRSTVPKVNDWPAVDSWVIKNKAPELFQRRLSVSAWNERTEAGVIVPGVEAFTQTSLVWRLAK